MTVADLIPTLEWSDVVIKKTTTTTKKKLLQGLLLFSYCMITNFLEEVGSGVGGWLCVCGGGGGGGRGMQKH